MKNFVPEFEPLKEVRTDDMGNRELALIRKAIERDGKNALILRNRECQTLKDCFQMYKSSVMMFWYNKRLPCGKITTTLIKDGELR